MSRPSSSRSISIEPLHARIYEAASKLILSGKRATPITLKTFFDNRCRRGRAARAAISRPARGQCHHHHQCRGLRPHRLRPGHPPPADQIGEDMVNTAFDSPIEAPPSIQIEGAEQQLYELAETGKYGTGFEPFSSALTDAIDMAANAYQRDGGLSGLSTGFTDLDRPHGRPAALRPHHHRRPPRHGQDGARHQHRLSRGQDLSAGRPTPRTRLTAP